MLNDAPVGQVPQMLQDQQPHHQANGFAGAALPGVIVPAESGLEDVPADLAREDVQRMLSVKLFVQSGEKCSLMRYSK